MAELGASTAQAHAQVGTLACELGVDHLVCVDAPEYAPAANAQGQTSVHLCDRQGAEKAAEEIEPGDVILVKASRSEHFEILAEAIEQVVRAQHIKSVGEGDQQ
jgi:UDP-N-acetylmuramoyl-tripeptide--D-alanyl-D-alanine ligase